MLTFPQSIFSSNTVFICKTIGYDFFLLSVLAVFVSWDIFNYCI
ncbi:unnamed protein product [Brassica rapa subsp. trilocularis]